MSSKYVYFSFQRMAFLGLAAKHSHTPAALFQGGVGGAV